MRLIATLFLVFCCLGLGWGQIYYSDNYTGEDGKGKIGTAAVDVSGVDWSIDITGGSFASGDVFAVQSGVFEAQDVDGNVVWTSETFSIAGASSLEFSFDAFADGNFEAGLDIFDVVIVIDGGASELLFSGTVDENEPGDPMFFGSTQLTGTLQNFAANVSGTGTDAYIEITVNNNSGLEIYGWDNLQVSEFSNCLISDIDIINAGVCNDNGTPSNSSDDFFTADVQVTYSNPPGSGTLDLSGSDVVGGNTSDPVSSSVQTISGVQLKADGNDVEITATFSEDGTCTYTETIAGSAVGSCSGAIPQVLITEIVDAADIGSNKYVEICNRGSSSIDITGWSIRRYANGSTSSSSANVSGTVVLSSGDCYLFQGSSSNLSTGSCSGSVSSGSISGNGDDVYELYDGSNSIDVYGVIGVDGTGEPWEYEDDIVTRISSTTFPSSTFNISEWLIQEPGNTSDATVCSDTPAGAPLPITLQTLTATPTSNTTHLHWRTATELNNDYMAVEHSPDGRRYTEVGRVLGAGTTQEPQDYSFVHEAPAPGLNYYRLRQVDYDGQYEYHGPVTARFGNAGGVLEVFPTATAGELTVSYQGQLDNDAMFSIQSVPGRTLRQWAWDSKSGRRATFSVADLPSGWYVLRLRNGREVVSGRFLKQ